MDSAEVAGMSCSLCIRNTAASFPKAENLFAAAADSGTKDHQTQEEEKVAQSENEYNQPVPGKHLEHCDFYTLKLDVGNQQQLVSSQASEGRGPQDVGREQLDEG